MYDEYKKYKGIRKAKKTGDEYNPDIDKELLQSLAFLDAYIGNREVQSSLDAPASSERRTNPERNIYVDPGFYQKKVVQLSDVLPPTVPPLDACGRQNLKNKKSVVDQLHRVGESIIGLTTSVQNAMKDKGVVGRSNDIHPIDRARKEVLALEMTKIPEDSLGEFYLESCDMLNKFE